MKNIQPALSTNFSDMRDALMEHSSNSSTRPTGSPTGVTSGLSTTRPDGPDYFSSFSNIPATHRTTHDNPTGITPGTIQATGSSRLETSPQELVSMIYRFVVLNEGHEFSHMHFHDNMQALAEGIARSIIDLMPLHKEFGARYRPLLLNKHADPVFKEAAMAYTENVIIKLALNYRKDLANMNAALELDQFGDLYMEETTSVDLLANVTERLSQLSQSSQNVFLNLAFLPEPELRTAALDAVVKSHSGASKNPAGPRTLRVSFKDCIGNGLEQMVFGDVLSFLHRLGGEQKEVHLELDVSDNHLSDAELCQLVQTIKNNKLNVTSLSLKRNQIRDETAQAVAELIKDGKLDILDLEGHQYIDDDEQMQRPGISASGIEALFSAIPRSRLKRLNLTGSFALNYLDDDMSSTSSNAETLRLIANQMPYCTSLTHLTLAENEIDSKGFYFLGKGLQGIFIEEGIEPNTPDNLNSERGDNIGSNNLQYLDVSENMTTYPDGIEPDTDIQHTHFSSFLDALKECKHLHTLDISKLGLEDPDGGAEIIGILINNYRSLSVLKMQDWRLESDSAAEFFKRVAKSNVKTFTIDAMFIIDVNLDGDDDARNVLPKNIADMLGEPNCNLEKLSMRHCGIDDDALIRITEKLSKNSDSKLTHLNLAQTIFEGDFTHGGKNSVTDKGATALAEMISKENSRLIHLNLDGNEVTSEGVEKLSSIMEGASPGEEPAPKLKFLSARKISGETGLHFLPDADELPTG